MGCVARPWPPCSRTATTGPHLQPSLPTLCGSKGDTLLIAGKGHETGQIIGTTVIPFSDQEAAKAALEGVNA